eukprot:CAMPEP_0197631328 /NCGR_PEP_ID=MMETSP1338-20131121/8526_1 /TAXON_ID=43686 ORGANISM="Pelagodinium beii, Strain RCC1491" /NCGR_SAMPLE_ID=MMETSP1338 /ASSEMBLY_ACC=CAM_ASM_000754 /LENGTH=417 /DNA_ID=CAMNT_0043202753 /DNA_START=88 /DNA_END=1341 /DNA_ORIENTATION=-
MLIGALDSVEFYTSSESMMEVIVMLWQDDVFVGAILLVIFAILIPVVKLTLIVAAEIMKWKRPELSSGCIHFVQIISKWACPDMFAYILFSYLIWDMDHPPTLTGRFQLDLGFTAYTMFCLGSTVSSLGMQKPKIKSKLATRPMPKWAFALLCFMAAVFSASLAVGLTLPVMAMRLDIGILVDRGEIPAAYVPIIEDLHIVEMASSDVTIPGFIWLMADTSEGFWLNSWIAVVLLAVFVVALPVFDMITLSIAALQSVRGACSSAFVVSEKVNKLAMLDVASLGIVVVVFSGSIYKKKGLVMSFCPGLLGMILASLCNIVAYQLVKAYAPLSALEVKDSAIEAKDCELAKEESDSQASTATLESTGKDSSAPATFMGPVTFEDFSLAQITASLGLPHVEAGLMSIVPHAEASTKVSL